MSNIWDYSHDMLDSVVITTSSERVKLDLSQYFTDYIDPSNVILFRNNDLDLPIRRAGDLIQVTTYSEAVH
ncbi:hypothetical protein FACS189413_17010 [Bacteroidia bacterium]|nr:hypothetical protein FACS189413_17010 [Bacteroidia bacterium]